MVYVVQRKIIEGIRSIKGKAGITMKFNVYNKVDFIFTNHGGIYVKKGTILMQKKGNLFRENKYLIKDSFEFGGIWAEREESCVWVKESKIIGLTRNRTE